MSSVFVLLFLCLSVHACNARLLGFIHNESGSKAYHSVDQDAGKVLRLSETSESSIRPTISVGCQAQVQVKNAGTVVTHEQVHASELTTGDDIIALSSQIDQPKSMKMKGLMRHTRSLMGSAAHDIEEVKDPKGNIEAVDEDVGVMDYAQPHRKPPIHNAKP